MNNFFNFESYQPADFTFPNFEEFELPSQPTEPIEFVEPSHEEFHSEIIQDGKKSHACTFPGCGKIFKFKSEITRHLVIHFVDRPFVCPAEGCGKAFKRADALENHVRIHTQDLPFQCDYPGCGLKFVTKSALRYHVLKHDNQRSFACEFEGCGKSFLTKAQLRQHQKAENYHKKVAAIHHVTALELPEPVKKLKVQAAPVASKDPYANLMAAPAPKLAKTLMWETKVAEDAEPFEIQPSADQGEVAEDMLNKVLEENKMLKEKLEIYTRMMEIFQENQKLKGQLSGKADTDFQFGFDAQAPQPVSYPMEGSEFSFLTF